MTKPVILAVDDDAQVLAAVRRDLRTRYKAGYSVLGAGSGEEALATLRELKSRGEGVAMIISDQRMPSMLGVELLSRSREFYPLARRVLLTAYSDVDAAVKAINEAHLDYYLSKPWDPPEDRLFPPLDDLLDAWQVEHLPEATGLRLVGHQWSPRSHAIKDFLAGNLVPYRWIDAQRDPEAPALLEAAGVTAEELPVLRSVETSHCVAEPMNAVFIFIGTRPHTEWLPAGLLRNEKGFLLTGRDAAVHEAFGRTWKQSREPLLLETSIPGVFAAGDVRAGAMNRVAAAVGEGSMVVRLVHEYLAIT